MTLISSRNGDAGFEDGFHGAGGGGVVVAEDGIGTGLEREQGGGWLGSR